MMDNFLKSAWAFVNTDFPASKLSTSTNIAGFLGLWIAVSAIFNNLTSQWWIYLAALLGAISLLGLVANLQEWTSKQGASRKAANTVVTISVIIIALIMLIPQFFGSGKVS